VGKPERKRPLGKLAFRLEDNIKVYLREIGLGHMDLFDLTQDRDR
jgi:hypothetical protein